MIEALLGLPGKVKTLLDRLTVARTDNLEQIGATRMAKIDGITANVDVNVSTRSPATDTTTILARTDVATSTRSSQTSVDTLTNRLSADRALNLDNIDIGLTTLPGGASLVDDTVTYPGLFSGTNTTLGLINNIYFGEATYAILPVYHFTANDTDTLDTYLNLTGPGVVTFLHFCIKRSSAGGVDPRIVVTIDGVTILDQSRTTLNSLPYFYSCVGWYQMRNPSSAPDGPFYGYVYTEGSLPFRDSFVIQAVGCSVTSTDVICAAKWHRWA